MNAELFQISYSQFEKMIKGTRNEPKDLSAAKLASEIIVLMFNSIPMCYVGLAPPTLLSDAAYIWMIVTPEGEAHPFLMGKYGLPVVQTALLKYKTIFGDCFSENSAKWLKHMGAEFTSETEFEFRRV